MNGGSYKKGGFNFDCFGVVVIYCKNGFLKFLKRGVLQPFFPKTQGFACKSGAILEFWLHALKSSLAWCKDFCSFNKL
ncbi:hypothetical protein A608_0120 [Helicobacter pylori CCHI 33]|nr:hypothetical protein A608_0120 [Helicobacter pylori CCHI 33]